MGMTMSELLDLRVCATARAEEAGADECRVAYYRGAANAVRSVLFPLASGEVVTRRELEQRLDKLKVRTLQPWNLRYAAYWSGAVDALEFILDRWAAAAA